MTALITNIQGYSIHDGPGIRTTVFFKGCPLECKWCANPECIEPRKQTGFISNLCVSCGTCSKICQNNAIADAPASYRIVRSRCTACGDCVEACNYGALVRYGAEMTPFEVFEIVRRDKIFFDAGGGGVTVSGGEPLLYANFVRELFEMCRADNISTCVETCGFVTEQDILKALPVTGYFLFDLKLMDPETHRLYTGKPNGIILENAALLSSKGADVLFRVPVIPGVNDGDENIDAAVRFIKSLPGKHGVQLMPYHRLGESKYAALDKANDMRGIPAAAPEQIEAVRRKYAQSGVDCSVSG